tara:strand:- start:3904 stop:4281 length:378 start_codon:yes stop_codon:yes gene_type:complete
MITVRYFDVDEMIQPSDNYEKVRYYLVPGRVLLRYYEDRKELRFDTDKELLDGVVSGLTEKMRIWDKGLQLRVDKDSAKPFLDLMDWVNRTKKTVDATDKNMQIIGSFLSHVDELRHRKITWGDY